MASSAAATLLNIDGIFIDLYPITNDLILNISLFFETAAPRFYSQSTARSATRPNSSIQTLTRSQCRACLPSPCSRRRSCRWRPSPGSAPPRAAGGAANSVAPAWNMCERRRCVVTLRVRLRHQRRPVPRQGPLVGQPERRVERARGIDLMVGADPRSQLAQRARCANSARLSDALHRGRRRRTRAGSASGWPRPKPRSVDRAFCR